MRIFLIGLVAALTIIGGTYYVSQRQQSQLLGTALPVLKVQQGGTGAATFSAGQCLVGNGTGPVTTAACGASGGGISDPFTHTAYLGQTTSATSTLLRLTASPFSLAASSTSLFDGASSTLLTVTTQWFTGLTSGGLAVDANGKVYKGATSTLTTISGQLDLTTQVTGDLPFANLAQVNANSVLGNNTNATADARSVATSTLFGATGVGGTVLGFNGGVWGPVATATCVQITGSSALCDGDDATGGGGGSATDKFSTSTNNTSIYANSAIKVGIGSSTPWAMLSLHATSTNGIGVPTTLFAIASSSQGTATSTLLRFTNRGSLAFGTNGTIAPGAYALSAGEDTTASGDGSVAFGEDSTASGYNSGAWGLANSATADFAFSIGHDNQAASRWAMSIGDANFIPAGAEFGIAIGASSTASAQWGVAIGASTTASGVGAVSIGASSTASGAWSTAMGQSNTVSGAWSFAGGQNSNVDANNPYSLAYGLSASITGAGGTSNGGNIALGTGAAIITSYDGIAGPNAGITSSDYSVALGDAANISATQPSQDNVAIGRATVGTGSTINKATAIGNDVSQTASTGMVIGNGRQVGSTLTNATDGIYFGTRSTVPTLIVTTGGGAVGSRGQVIIGTSTPTIPSQELLVTHASNPQLALGDNTSGDNLWTFRSINNNLYIASSTATATSSVAAFRFDTNGFPYFNTIAAASGSNCLQVDTTGKVTNTGSACGAGGGIADPFTHGSTYSTTTSATTTSLWTQGAFFASSTIATSTFDGGLVVGGKSITPYLRVGSTTPNYGYFANDLVDVYDARNDELLLNIGNGASGSCASAGLAMNGNIPTASNNFLQIAFANAGWTGVGCSLNAKTAVVYGDGFLYNPTNSIDIIIGSTSASAAFKVFTANTLPTSEKFRVANSGAVGIGSTSPWGLLSVHGMNGANLNTVPLFAVGTSTATATTTEFMIDYTGRVGIGSSSPSALLSVFAASSTAGSGGFLNSILFAIGSSSNAAVNSTTTLFSVNNVGLASTTNLNISSVSQGQTGTTCLQITALGVVQSAGATCGISDPFTHPLLGFSATTSALLVGTSTGKIANMLVGSSTNPQLALSNNGTGGDPLWTFRVASSTFYLATSTFTATSTGPAALSIDSTGRLSVGKGVTFSKAQSLRWNDDNDAIFVDDNPTILSKGNAMVFKVYNGDSSNGAFVWGDYNNNPKMVLDAFNGRLGIASSTPWRTLSVVGTMAANGLTVTSSGNAVCINATTFDVENAGAGACVVSTRLAKHDISTIPVDFSKEVMNLRPVQYILNGTKDEWRYGFIAEEAALVDPRLVEFAQTDTTVPGIDGKSVTVKKGQPLTFDYMRYAGMLTAFVQHIERQIEALFKKDTAQDAQIKTLQQQLQKQQQEIDDLKKALSTQNKSSPPLAQPARSTQL